MDVILLQDVDKVGLRGDVVNVARGYARNYLLPRRLAEVATTARVAELQKHEEQRARHEAKTFEQAQQIAETLGRAELRFDVKAGPTGSLFGSVTPTDIAEAIWRTQKVRVDRRKIDLEEPIKRIGRFEVPIELFTDVTVDVKTVVVPEGGELPPEEELEAMRAAEEAEAAAAEEAAAEREAEIEAAVAEVEAEETEAEAAEEGAEADLPEGAVDQAGDAGVPDETEER
jgi:large subunit ribosomal protein L9